MVTEVQSPPKARRNPFQFIIVPLQVIGRGAGNVVGILYQSGRDTIDQVIHNVLPFMAFISFVIGVILATGVGNAIATGLKPLAETLPGLLGLTLICALPFLSPLLGPGAVIAQIVGTLIGVEIGRKNINPQFALPALFAINPQVGCDFIPVGLALGEAEPQTTEIGVPAVLISRLITGPMATILAYFASFGLYS
jgi:glucitol/sorbitol PTS system EIIB component